MRKSLSPCVTRGRLREAALAKFAGYRDPHSPPSSRSLICRGIERVISSSSVCESPVINSDALGIETLPWEETFGCKQKQLNDREEI